MRVVAGPQPLDELHDVDVAPHPRGEPLEVRQRGVGVEVEGLAQHVAVHPVGIWPVRFDGDGVEALLLDQPLRDPGPLAVEVVRPVGRLADEDVTALPDAGHQPVVVAAIARDGRYADHASTVHPRGHADKGRWTLQGSLRHLPVG